LSIGDAQAPRVREPAELQQDSSPIQETSGIRQSYAFVSVQLGYAMEGPGIES
jgi:hypothetical protein